MASERVLDARGSAQVRGADRERAAHLLFVASAALLFALAVELPHYAAAVGLDAAGATPGDRLALSWLLVAKSLAPLLPFQLFALAASRSGVGGWARRLLDVATGTWALWLVLDVFVQSQFGAHLASYLPFAASLLGSRDQLQWVGDPVALALAVAKLLVATALAGLALRAVARWLAHRVASRRFAAVATALYAALVLAAFPAQRLLAAPELRKSVAMSLPYAIDWSIAGAAGEASRELHLLGVVPWAWRSPDLAEVLIYNPAREARRTDGWQLENAAGQRLPLHGEIAPGATLRFEVERARFALSRNADAVALIGPGGAIASRVAYRDEDVKRGAALWNPPSTDADGALARIGDAAQPAYAAMFPSLRAARPATFAPGVAARADAPNVILLVVESFRHEVVGPDLLARLDALGARGLRSTRHYSGSNSSHLGLFALLFGRLSLFYDALLDADPTPTAAQLFRRLGYRTAYVSSAESESWKRMDQFLGERGFDEVRLEIARETPLWKQWPDCDRRTLDAIRAITSRPGPHFIVGFLMSTHFPYPYPPDFARFGPVSHEDEIPSWDQLFRAPLDRDKLWNRYRNAALALESQLVDFAASLDPARNVIAITGDHGESFGEDGALVHGSRASDAQTRVPLVIVGAGVPAKAIASPTSHLDVLPTLLHVATGVADPVQGLDGRDLLGATPPREEVFVAPYKLTQPYDLLWMRGERRVLFRVRVDRPELDAFAFVDASGFPVLAPDASLLADTAPLVARVGGDIERLGGGDGAAAPVGANRR